MNNSDRKELVAYRLNKANQTLKEIEILLKNELWNTAVNRMYYACYYAVSALLINSAIQAQTSNSCKAISRHNKSNLE
jgi:uncharacterized protein (UPF0332 family)